MRPARSNSCIAAGRRSAISLSSVPRRTGEWLASGGEDGQVRLWTLTGDRQCDVFEGRTRPVRCVAISPDGCWLASVADDRSLVMPTFDLAHLRRRAP
ncbi:WD40 repeat domain-containing protein [Streptomyces sp. NPDC091972]|uniref:WD40 repeat domain-containing protein n=1 Tax=Streptomyces sp. NPDC091972 TaxID=3366007 RepID=UPI003806B2D8